MLANGPEIQSPELMRIEAVRQSQSASHHCSALSAQYVYMFAVEIQYDFSKWDEDQNNQMGCAVGAATNNHWRPSVGNQLPARAGTWLDLESSWVHF